MQRMTARNDVDFNIQKRERAGMRDLTVLATSVCCWMLLILTVRMELRLTAIGYFDGNVLSKNDARQM